MIDIWQIYDGFMKNLGPSLNMSTGILFNLTLGRYFGPIFYPIELRPCSLRPRQRHRLPALQGRPRRRRRRLQGRALGQALLSALPQVRRKEVCDKFTYIYTGWPARLITIFCWYSTQSQCGLLICTKRQLSFWCQKKLGINLTGHPVMCYLEEWGSISPDVEWSKN